MPFEFCSELRALMRSKVAKVLSRIKLKVYSRAAGKGIGIVKGLKEGRVLAMDLHVACKFYIKGRERY